MRELRFRRPKVATSSKSLRDDEIAAALLLEFHGAV
jgi:hypothetical protein